MRTRLDFIVLPRQIGLVNSWANAMRVSVACVLMVAISSGLGLFNIGPVAADDLGLRQWRKPVSILLNSEETALLLANEKSGTISRVDLASKQVSEFRVGSSLRDLADLPGPELLTVDFQKHELVRLREGDGGLKVIGRTRVARYPHAVVASKSGSRVFVSSLWSRRISALKRETDGGYTVEKTIDLSFAPREMTWVENESQLVVADQFGGTLAVLDAVNLKVTGRHKVSGHNIRGLALANGGDTLVMTHQMLNELAHTSRNDIHWGLLMSNDLRWISVDALLRQEPELYRFAHMHPLGKENNAAGDPGNLAVANNGIVVVTLSGVNEIAFGREDDFWLKRAKVGRRPVDVVVDENNRWAYVANAGDDSVTQFDLDSKQVVTTFSLGAQPQFSLAQRGEQLFFDASLSHDGWMSCHSCHTEGHSNGGLNDNFSDESFGAPKKVLTLLGKKETAPFAWRGNVASIKQQVHNSIQSTMQSKVEPEPEWVAAITEFVEQLPPPPALDKAREKVDPPIVRRGREVFESMGCAQCHAGDQMTSPELFAAGLEDEQGNKKFNPPSLIGVSQRDRFFHDARARSLKEVLFKVQHRVPSDAKAADLELLRRYLQSI